MRTVEIFDNMETTKTEFQNPGVIIQRKSIVNILVSKNKTCGLNYLGLVLFLPHLQLGQPGKSL